MPDHAVCDITSNDNVEREGRDYTVILFDMLSVCTNFLNP
jgi:hypothetical protein